MTLVERFIEFNDWPTSRKTALLSGLAIPAHLFANVVTDILSAQRHLIDRPLVDLIVWAWLGSIAFCFVVSFAVARRGFEGRWTAPLLILPYGFFMACLMFVFGMASTALSALYPLAILVVAVSYGPRHGVITLLYVLCMAVLLLFLQVNGRIPFAPALLDRNLDAQNDTLFALTVFYVFVQIFVVCFALVMLLLRARQLQQEKLDEAHEKLEHSNRLIRRYVPSQLAEKIIQGDHSELFKPERAKVTVFFSDIEGFTEASDHLDPEDLAALLNEYLSEMMVIAERHGATINQIVGDGIMIFFGAPQATSDKDHALRAVRMALEMQRRMVELEDVWVNRGIQKPFRARIGINTGHASVGDYGSPGRKLYSAIGVQTNLAARIQAHCDPGKVLFSHSTWALVHDDFPCTGKGELTLKGVHYPVPVYEIEIDRAPPPSAESRRTV